MRLLSGDNLTANLLLVLSVAGIGSHGALGSDTLCAVKPFEYTSTVELGDATVATVRLKATLTETASNFVKVSIQEMQVDDSAVSEERIPAPVFYTEERKGTVDFVWSDATVSSSPYPNLLKSMVELLQDHGFPKEGRYVVEYSSMGLRSMRVEQSVPDSHILFRFTKNSLDETSLLRKQGIFSVDGSRRMVYDHGELKRSTQQIVVEKSDVRVATTSLVVFGQPMMQECYEPDMVGFRFDTLAHENTENDAARTGVIDVQKKTVPQEEGALGSRVWNDTNTFYDRIKPLAERQRDVVLFPKYNSFLFATKLGLATDPRDIAGVELATGAFAGFGSSKCLAGDFQLYDKIFAQAFFLGEVYPLLEIEGYVRSYLNNLDSRLFCSAGGEVYLNVSLEVDCRMRNIPIVDLAITLLEVDTKLPIDIGDVNLEAFLKANVKLQTSYDICLGSLNPYLSLDLIGDVGLAGALGAQIEVGGIRRYGVKGEVNLSYTIGPATELGSKQTNDTCAACIGVYQSNEDMNASFFTYEQKKTIRGDWGPEDRSYIGDWREPAQPWHPLVEACS